MRFSVEEVEVGPFLVDLTTGRILRDGIELGLRPQAFRVFKTLIQNRGQYVDHEHMIVEGVIGVPLLEVPFESSPCCLVQGYETALTKFSTSDHQTIWCDVIQPQPDRLGHPQSRACQQREQRAVGRSTKRFIS